MQIVYIILLMSCRADPGKSVALTKYQRNQEEPDPHCNNLFLISSWPLDDPYSSLTSVTVLSTFHGNKISWSKTQRHANQWCTWTSAFTGQDKKKKGVRSYTEVGVVIPLSGLHSDCRYRLAISAFFVSYVPRPADATDTFQKYTYLLFDCCNSFQWRIMDSSSAMFYQV